MKKALALLLVSLLVLALFAGCTSTSPSADPVTPPPSSTGTVTPTPPTPTPVSPPPEAGMASWEAFASEVAITVPVYDRAKPGYPSVTDNYWTKYVQTNFGDKYNIKVNYVDIPRGDVMTRYSMLFAAQQIPTILMEYDYPKVAEWAGDGALTVLNLEDFAFVAPNFYQAMVDNKHLGYTDLSGKTYFVLTERAYYNTTYTFATFVRLDWLKQIGMTAVPKSYAEFTSAMDAIIAQGICANPVDFGLPPDAYTRNFAYRPFPVDEAEWAMHSSLGTASLSWEPTKKMLKRFNDEFKKGYYSPEYDLDDPDVVGASGQMLTNFVNGKAYRYGGYMANDVSWLKTFYTNNPGAELAIQSDYWVVEPGVVDFPQIRADNPFGMIVGFGSSASADQLKAAWMLMEWMQQPEVLFEMENGVLGVTYNLDANGLPVMVADYMGPEMLNHNNNIDMTCLIHAVKKVGTIEETIRATAPQGLPQDFTQALLDRYAELKSFADNGWAYSDPVYSVVLDESEYTGTLLSLWKEYHTTLVKCAPADFEAKYAELSTAYLNAGYKSIIDARKAAYDAGSTTKLPK